MLPAMYVIPHGGIFVIANLALQRMTELKRAILDAQLSEILSEAQRQALKCYGVALTEYCLIVSATHRLVTLAV